MIFSFIYDNNLSVPEEERNFGDKESSETGIIIKYDDVDETLFDMNDHGLYLYPVYQTKLGNGDTYELSRLKIIGVDII